MAVSTLDRATRGIRKYGAAGAFRRAAGPILSDQYLRERHIWYALDLREGSWPHLTLASGLTLSRVTSPNEARVDLVGQFSRADAAPPDVARRRLAEGHELWLVHQGQAAAFGCWIFRGRCPVAAARGGALDLPPGVVCLEESVTHADFRGRGIAPAAWSLIADGLQAEGLRAMVTKVAVTNIPSRRAVEKAGFREVAEMAYLRVGPARRVDVFPRPNGGAIADELGTRLTRTPWQR